MITKLIASIGMLCVSFFVTIATMIFGWGLEPKNWAVIIFIGFLGQIIVAIMSAIAMHGGEK